MTIGMQLSGLLAAGYVLFVPLAYVQGKSAGMEAEREVWTEKAAAQAAAAAETEGEILALLPSLTADLSAIQRDYKKDAVTQRENAQGQALSITQAQAQYRKGYADARQDYTGCLTDPDAYDPRLRELAERRWRRIFGAANGHENAAGGGAVRGSAAGSDSEDLAGGRDGRDGPDPDRVD